MCARIALLISLIALTACGSGLSEYKDYQAGSGAVLQLEARNVTDGVFSDSGVRINVFNQADANCDREYMGSLFAKLGSTVDVGIPAGAPFFARIVYAKSNAWLGYNSASWTDFVFTPRKGYTYKVIYIKEEDAYDIELKEISPRGRVKDKDIVSWPRC